MELLEAIDQGAVAPFRHISGMSALAPLLVGVVYLGDRLVLLVVLLLAVAGFLKAQQTRPAVLLTAFTLAALAIAHLGQIAIHRDRPNVGWSPPALPTPETPSFPSDHALGATVLYGSLGVLLARRLARRWPVVAGVVLAFLAGLAQLLVGHNFVSDVLAGWAAGTVLAMLCVGLDRPEKDALAGANAP